MEISILLLLIVVRVLVGVAFFTLFERKLLGYIQLRKGPNKTGFTGILQPFADAIKLFTKEHVKPIHANYSPFFLAPVIRFSLALTIWSCIPSFYRLIPFNLSILFFLVCTGMNVYSLLAAGWSSNSKYSLIGALRGVAQTISYEVSLALLLLRPVILIGRFSFGEAGEFQNRLWFVFLFPLLRVVWFISCLAETNRTPFDFAEGERELVSGYNTEYGGGGFALIILAEYTRILFISILFTVIFLGGDRTNIFFFSLIAFSFVWVRGTLPRFRYDKLIGLAWKCFLPFSLFHLVLITGLLA